MNNPRMVVWNQRSPIIYRYMERKYVDDFFEKGELRLSSFRRFKKHTDEQRKDLQEGNVVSCIKGEDFTVYGRTEHATNALIMSASLLYEDRLFEAFDVDDCFAINNAPQFGLEICKKIPHCVAGLEGSCVYVEKRVIESDSSHLNAQDFTIDHGNNTEPVTKPTELTQEEMNRKFGEQFKSVLGDDVIFLKEKNYSSQLEYRLVWFLELDMEAPESLDIVCPEAIQFCTRIT